MNFHTVSALRSSLSLLLMANAMGLAGEVVIETKPFAVESSFKSWLMPANDVPRIQLDPKAWGDFTIVSVLDHGARVEKGGTVVAFESKAIDRRIEDLRATIASSELTLTATAESLKTMEATAAKRLEATRREAQRAAEELAYFTTTGRKADEESAAQELERARQFLENEKEELRQLKAMYEADDLTEDTEEIILVRQKNSVDRAEFGLRMQQLRHARTLEVTLPRRAVDLAEADRIAKLNLSQAESSIPRGIEQQKLQLAALETQLERNRAELAELEGDRALFEIKASADSTVYHGDIDKGAWTTGDLIKQLKPGGKLPADQVFITLVPDDTPLQLVSRLTPATAQPITGRLSGIAVLEGLEEAHIPVEVISASRMLDTSGCHLVKLKATWPKGCPATLGTPLKVRLITHQNPAAISVPADALRYGVDGWSVELKLADGKSERRKVVRGRTANGQIEILAGLEAGQVIVTP